MRLSPVAVRVLGALVEKRMTTPNQYPLSIAALVAACNQRSARDPVMDLDEAAVAQGLRELREHDLARTSPVRGRVARHEHTLARQLDLDDAAQAALGVLLLRGPQTAGEIRTRTERWHGFGGVDEVEATLRALAEHAFLPLVVELPREPGRREHRWTHLLGDPAAPDAAIAAATSPAADDGASPATPSATAGALTRRVDELEVEVGRLRSRLDEVVGRLAPLLEDDG